MKSKLSRIAVFVMCLLLTLSVAAFALAETTGDAAAAAGAANPEVSPVAALLSTPGQGNAGGPEGWRPRVHHRRHRRHHHQLPR